jgi:hypothetical protein
MEKFVPNYEQYPVYFYREFLDMQLDNKDVFKHQQFLSKYFGNIFIDKHELLLFHTMGTGKTNSAISIIERLMEMYPYEYKGAIVLTKGQGLVYNFIREILKCTSGKYDVFKQEITDRQYRKHLKKNIEETYTFFTFEVFVKMIKDMSNTLLRNRFESYIFVLDEVHNIRDSDSTLNVYEEMHRLLHTIQHRKILLMSGTPMKDNPNEIASIMNLILPIDKQMPVDQAFTTTFFDDTGKLKNKDLLKSYLRGRVSFLKNDLNDIKSVKMYFHGNVIFPLKHFKIIRLEMSETQNSGYEIAWKLDQENVNIYSNSRQASQFVDEHGNFGKKVKSSYVDIGKCSCKYEAFIKRLVPNEKTIAYSDIVRGSGLNALARCLESVGYTRDIKKPKSFIVLTSNMSEVQKQHYINVFNSPENVYGDLISILLGSRVILEGYTFLDVIHEHVFTGHWNFSETAQMISRGWRSNSHSEYVKRTGKVPQVNVYMYAAIPKTVPSIDLMMYKIAEQKDVAISQVIRAIQEAAIDCWLFKLRNKTLGFDGQRECQYMECNYTCDEERKCTDTIISEQFDLYHFKFSYEWDWFMTELSNLFQNQWIVHWQELEHYRDFQIAQIVLYCVKNHFVFVNPIGYQSHVRYNKDGLFLVPLYYTGPCVTQAYLLCKYQKPALSISYENLVLKYTLDNIHEYIKLFYNIQNPIECAKILNHFPIFIQEIILQNVLKLKIYPNETYQKLLNLVYSHYETNIYETNTHIGYNLKTAWCIEKSSGKSVNLKIVLDYFQKRKLAMESNPYGYYGQENRIINEFCIKVADAANYEDKRKIQPGRRCINWSKQELIELCTNIFGHDNYNTYSRHDLCTKLKQFFRKNNLLENDNTCGTQYKKKG